MRRPLLPVAAAAAAFVLALAGGLPAAGAGERRAAGSAAAGSPAANSPAGEAGRDLAALRAEMIDAAMGILAEQERLFDLERELAVLEAGAAARRAALEAGRDRLERLLGGLQRLARVPPEALIARPGAPLDTVRGALLLRAAVPALEARAAVLRRDLAGLAVLHHHLTARRARAEALRASLDADIAGLAVLAARRTRLRDEAAEPPDPAAAAAARSLADHAGQARTLHDLMDGVAVEPDHREEAAAAAEAETVAAAGELRQAAMPADPEERAAVEPVAAAPAPAGETVPGTTGPGASPYAPPGAPDEPAADAQAAGAAQPAGPAAPAAAGPQLALAAPPTTPPLQDGVLLPAGGTVILGFGEPDLFGTASRGLVLEVFPGAPVIAPLDGQVRFAGAFRGYGDILILEHSGGYHTLIAGFGRIDVRVGQDVLAGEPIGVTPSPQTGDREAPTLYFEFRRNGQPIDPLQGLPVAQGRG